MKCRPRPSLLALLTALVLGVATAPSLAANPHALWQIVHEHCVPDQQQSHKPAPCAVVDEPGGFAVLKDLVGAEQYLLIPTARIPGIESPDILRPGAPNFFADAWAQIPLVEARLHRTLPREDFSLAINSAYGRSQDQLHIHIECIDPQIHQALTAQLGQIGEHWSELPIPLAGHHYRALRIAGDTLGDTNPFHLLAASLPDKNTMGRHTLVLVGANFPQPGFILLDDHVDLLRADMASGAELQDHACAIAGRAAGR